MMVNEEKKIKITKCIIEVYRENGIRGGLYKGFSLNIFKGPFANAISFGVRDFLNKKFIK